MRWWHAIRGGGVLTQKLVRLRVVPLKEYNNNINNKSRAEEMVWKDRCTDEECIICVLLLLPTWADVLSTYVCLSVLVYA